MGDRRLSAAAARTVDGRFPIGALAEEVEEHED